MSGIPFVPTTKMADAHKYSVLGNHCQENHVICLKLRPRLNFVPRFLESIPRHVFSINTSSSNTPSLFPNFYCSANTFLSAVWLSHSPTDVKGHKWISVANIHFFKILWLWNFFQPRKHRHRKKWTFKNM